MKDRITAWAAALLIALAFLPGMAAAAVPARCHAHGDIDRDKAGAEAGAAGDDAARTGADPDLQLPPADAWICAGRAYDPSRDMAWLLFTARDLAKARGADHLVTGIGRFERLSLIAMGPDGPIDRRDYRMADVTRLVNGPMFAVRLPDLSQAETLVVAIRKPWNVGIIANASLQRASGPAGTQGLGWPAGVLALIAACCGLLLAPLFYNLSFYGVLRQRFVLWHSVMVFGMMVYALSSSGLIHWFAEIDLASIATLNPLSFALPTSAAAMFTATYLEKGALSRRMRGIVIFTGIGSLLVIGVICMPFPFLRTWYNDLYFLFYLPILGVLTAAMVQAARRGSRAVWFQIAGWTPMMLAGAERILRGLGLYSVPVWVDQLIYLALALEIQLTALGVVDRFQVLRRERDRANARIEVLSTMLDRDSLTGLYNRRALEERFAEYRSTGYSTLAVLDLDSFKAINDNFGHAVGDRVLQEVAAVLSTDAEILAFRMGGEEFLLLLRGSDSFERAERLRSAIPDRIAVTVPEVTMSVTASMGLIRFPRRAITPLAPLYESADRLLYEAKNTGRDRTVSDRPRVFKATEDERRESERRGAGPITG